MKVDKAFYINKIIAGYAENLSRQHSEIQAGLKSARAIPGFPELEKEIAAAEIDISKAESENKDCKADNERLKKLYEKREKLLKDNGIITSVKYSCKKCRDSGWTGKTLCACIKQKLHAEILKDGFVPLPDANFKNTDFTVFMPEVREDIEKLYGNMRNHCKKFPDTAKLNVFITGKVGVGKTHLLCCMANALLEKGVTVQFLSAFSFNNLLLKYHTAPMESKEGLLSPLLDTEELFIDDLGSETLLNNVTVEYLYHILNERQISRRHTVITTNLSADALLLRYGSRVHSRLMNKQLAFIGEMPGQDLRIAQKERLYAIKGK